MRAESAVGSRIARSGPHAPRATPLDAPGRTRTAAGQRGEREVGSPQGSLLGGHGEERSDQRLRARSAGSPWRGSRNVPEVASLKNLCGVEGAGRGRDRSAELGLPGQRQVQHEVEPGPEAGSGLDLQGRAHRLDQFAADGEPEPGAREGVLAGLLPPAERLDTALPCSAGECRGRCPGPRTRPRGRRSPRAVTSTNPSAVNLSALVVRLSSTRLSATGWPIRKSASGAVSRTARLFSSAMAGRCRAPTRGCRSPRTGSGRDRPAGRRRGRAR